jgi:5-methylcytosine-specific restriction endonuclease McrA
MPSLVRKKGMWFKPKRKSRRFQSKDYRQLALDHHGEFCAGCGYEGFVKLLEVHHKDGDPNNNVPWNWQILCVMCHAKVHRLGMRF